MSLWRSLASPQRIAALGVFVVLGAVGFLPLFGGPGYEQALASGLLLPSAAAIATAIELSATDRSPVACVATGVFSGARLAAVAFFTALLHGCRVGFCDLWGGSVDFVLTAGFGAVLGGAWGAVAAELGRRQRRRRLACTLLALAGPVAGIAGSVARFYSSPMIFSYDPFFGYFSGTLYDTVVDERAGLWTYRAGSLATLAGVSLLATAFARTDRGTWKLAPAGPFPAAARPFLGLASLAGSLMLALHGPELGHWQTAETIARALGGRAAGPHCDVVYPASLLPDQAALLVRDCEQELAADEAKLGARLDGRLTAYVFLDENQKRALMGAAQTSIAKPWRREVYVQVSPYPHPILGHEVAHVVAGSFGRGPFRIAAGRWGLLPNPGLIEGIAVATSPDDDELTDAQWARAMLDADILPPVRSLFSLGFLGENAAKSYTTAGSFVGWVIERWGASKVRAWYGGESIEKVTGEAWDALDRDFRVALRALPMPPGATAYARAKFGRPSVWARRCPHVVDALNRDGDRCLEEHAFARADDFYARALGRDPRSWHARLARARIDAWYGDEARGRGELSQIAADADAPRTWKDRAEETLADEDLARGRGEAALSSYRSLASHTLDEDIRRTLDVKAASVDSPPARRAVLDLLVGGPGHPSDPWLAALSMGAWAAQTEEPLAAYTVGKNLAFHEQPARAAVWLDRALDEVDRGASLAPSIGRELLRQRVMSACALGDRSAVERALARVESPDSPFSQSAGSGRKEWVLRLATRCLGPSP